MCEHGVYMFKTKINGEVFYIGKSDSSIEKRIESHVRAKGTDKKFKEYIDNGYDVFIGYLPNHVETELMERALINKYKPRLNDVYNSMGFSGLIQVIEPQWVKYQRKEVSQNMIKKAPLKKRLEKKEKSVYEKYSKSFFLIQRGDVITYITVARKFWNEDAIKRLENMDFVQRYVADMITLCENYGVLDRCGYRVKAEAVKHSKLLSFLFKEGLLFDMGTHSVGENISGGSNIIPTVRFDAKMQEVISFSVNMDSFRFFKRLVASIQ